jgi:DNA primase
MTPIETFLSRLERVKGKAGQWTAVCPAHEDRSPSLSVRLLDDGRVLCHCFGGCDVSSVLGAVQMTLSDLFPKSDGSVMSKPAIKQRFYPSDLMRIIHFETLIVMVAAYDLSVGKTLKKTDKERLQLSYERIDEAMRFANVN